MRLTFASKAIIAALIILGLYFGIRRFTATNPELARVGQTTPGTPVPVDTIVNSGGADTPATAAGARPAFTYEAPAPVDGKLKGVVELGASGFNSFIVRIDQNRTWKLEKADFGNSLVMENMATDDDIRRGLKTYISQMLDFGVSGRDIHFVVSSGAAGGLFTFGLLVLSRNRCAASN